MHDLILDPTTMNPHLKYLIPNSLGGEKYGRPRSRNRRDGA